jgi:hypothetical protein
MYVGGVFSRMRDGEALVSPLAEPVLFLSLLLLCLLFLSDGSPLAVRCLAESKTDGGRTGESRQKTRSRSQALTGAASSRARAAKNQGKSKRTDRFRGSEDEQMGCNGRRSGRTDADSYADPDRSTGGNVKRGCITLREMGGLWAEAVIG